MAKKDDIRPLQSVAPDEHTEREAASKHSGFQPAEKFANQGSEPYTLNDALKSSARSGLSKK